MWVSDLGCGSDMWFDGLHMKSDHYCLYMMVVLVGIEMEVILMCWSAKERKWFLWVLHQGGG